MRTVFEHGTTVSAKCIVRTTKSYALSSAKPTSDVDLFAQKLTTAREGEIDRKDMYKQDIQQGQLPRT